MRLSASVENIQFMLFHPSTRRSIIELNALDLDELDALMAAYMEFADRGKQR